MFYELTVKEHIRVEPELFGLEEKEAIKQQLEKTYGNYMDNDIGAVVSVLGIEEIGEGIIVPGDGAAYYSTTFRVLAYKPELQEIVYGVIEEITNFGAFINLGVVQGMIHISQTMDDYVSFSKSNTLAGKNSKRSLKKGDLCLARIVAISYKSDEPKIGLTMRQPGLGKLEWIEQDKKRSKKIAPAEGKEKKTKKEKK